VKGPSRATADDAKQLLAMRVDLTCRSIEELLVVAE
jgi:hypothetical protein